MSLPLSKDEKLALLESIPEARPELKALQPRCIDGRYYVRPDWTNGQTSPDSETLRRSGDPKTPYHIAGHLQPGWFVDSQGKAFLGIALKGEGGPGFVFSVDAAYGVELARYLLSQSLQMLDTAAFKPGDPRKAEAHKTLGELLGWCAKTSGNLDKLQEAVTAKVMSELPAMRYQETQTAKAFARSEWLKENAHSVVALARACLMEPSDAREELLAELTPFVEEAQATIGETH